jgi:hypothetical protein
VKPLDNLLDTIGSVLKHPMFEMALDYFTYIESYKSTIEHLNESTKEDTLLIESIVAPSVSSAILTSMYGDFEFYLNKLCEAYRKSLSLNLSFNDIAGSGTVRAVNYLEKVIGVKGIKQSKEWAKIRDWNSIRNALIHNNGILKDKENSDAAKRLGLTFKQDFLEAGITKLNVTLENCTEFGTCSMEFFAVCGKYEEAL